MRIISPFIKWDRLCALVCLLFVLPFLHGCGDKKPTTKKIILLNNTESPFWDAARAGIKQAIIDLKLAEAGFEAHMDANTGGEEGQIEKLKQYNLQKDIVGVILSPMSATNAAIVEELKKLKEKGVVIGCFDSDLAEQYRANREFFVGTNSVKGGEVLGTAAANLRPQGGQYIQFVGRDSQKSGIERMNGFTAAIGKSFEEKGRMVDQEDRNKARDNVRNAISKFPDLSILAGIWSYNGPAIVDVVKEKKMRDKFAIVVFDAEPAAIGFMAQGEIDAMVVQNPFRMGYESVKYVFAKKTNDNATIKVMYPNIGKPGGDILDTGIKVVVPEKNTPLKKEPFEKVYPSIEFLTLPEFQKWLDKYSLKSS
jgi:ribose transport system substrate-binding protein